MEKRYRNHDDGEQQVYVRRGCSRGQQKDTGREKRGRDIVVQTEERHAAAGRTQLSISDPYY